MRMIILWKERGFGWWLLGGLWAATYNLLLLLPRTVVKNIMVFNREQAEKALPTQGGIKLGRTNQVVQPLQGETASNPTETRRPNEEGTYKADDSPYYSVDRQLG
jgi:hypothetical protein